MVGFAGLGLVTAIGLAGVPFCKARVYESLAGLPRNKAYDFIVVGSGPGGATVASRLSEDRQVTVLLVEAGPNDEGVQQLQVPGQYFAINETYNWNYMTTPQTGLNDRSIPYARGHVLGGTSSTNGMAYTRGARDDYDNWAKITGDQGWRWDKLVPYFKKNENWTAPLSGRNISGEFDPSVHGYGGELQTSLAWGGPTRVDELAFEVTEDSTEFPFVLDYNAGRPLGVGWSPLTIGNGERSSASTAYLSPAVRRRRNLDIVVNTYALRAIPTGNRRVLDVRTVELGVRFSDRATVKLTARKELILAAGTFGTPQILLNSGIGDRNDLRRAGVTPIHHLPDVGRGMTDHVTVTASFAAVDIPQPPPSIDPLEQWLGNRTGPLSEPYQSHHVVWSKFPSNSSLWSSYQDPSPGKTAPHVEIIPIVYNGGFGAPIIALLSPYSRGSVKINSTDAYADPLIDLGFLTHPFDMEAMREALRLAKRFFGHQAWEGYILSSLTPDPESPTFEQEVRDIAGGLWHPVGTAAMSARNSKRGVVDPDLRVKGITGLRIVDASVIPYVPAAHTQAPVYVLAERISDVIKATWRR